MTAQIPVRTRAEHSPRQHALIALLAILVVAGGSCLAAVLTAPAAAVAFVAWAGGVAAAVVGAAGAMAVYYAQTVRYSRDRIARAQASAVRLEQELARLAEDTGPAMVRRLRDGEPAERVLVSHPQPSSGNLQRLLQLLVSEIGEGERRSAAALALRRTLEDEAAQLADEIVPVVVGRVRDGEAAAAALAAVPRPASDALLHLLQTMVAEIARGERRGAAAMAACASAAARVQAQTTRTLAELRELEQRYGEEKVFADLLEIDHRISQMGRLADSIALLAGGRSGRRWTKPIVIESILRGAMGRIDAYRRIRLHSTSTVAISGYAAEGVMHVLAELMDNAAAFSAHGSDVHVYVEEEDAGVVVTIEDGGLGMRKRERRRAEELVTEAHDLTNLPGTRLGLAVVGRLASRYGLAVNFRPSSRGGTGVVVMIPRQLLTQSRPEDSPVIADAAARSAVPVAAGQLAAGDTGAEEGMLPKRPRGRTLAAASRPAAAPAQPVTGPQDSAARFAAFRHSGERARHSPAGPPGTDGE